METFQCVGFLIITILSLGLCLQIDHFESSKPRRVFAIPSQNVSSTPMIINGWEMEESKFPFMVSIQIMEQKYKRYHVCGAVLVATNKAITAAHCLHYWGDVDHYAAVGFKRLSQHGQALVKIVDVFVHRGYKAHEEGFPNDIALIIFEEHVELSDRVQLANLTKPGDPSYDNEYCYVTGWGMTEDHYSYPDELHYTLLLSLGKRDCKKFFKVFDKKGLIRYQHKCAWHWPNSICYGDSGGPLVCRDQVVGITSWAPDCAGCFPVVFANVAAFRHWIDNKT